MATLFVSDVHLSADRPERVDAFIDFLGGAASRADALYVLGDLFDLWLGDDDDRDPHPRVVAALAGLTAAGVPTSVVLGNHDFLLGAQFAARSGCTLIEESTVVTVHGRRVLLMHGDTLCTHDVDYQNFRRYVRDPGNQAGFLALALEARLAEARRIRRSSSEATRLKPEDIMDVSAEAVLIAMDEAGVDHLVHGHTHRPAVHAIDDGAGERSRIVLGDWYDDDSVLAWSESGPRLGRLSNLTI